MVITDHQEISGACELQNQKNFKVIVGEEIETQDGDIIGLFLKKKIQSGLPIEQTISKIKQQRGLVYLPHPFDRLRKNTINQEKLEEIIDQVDIVEVFNSRNVFRSDNKKALDLAEKYQKIKACGNDAHTIFEVNRAYMKIDEFTGQNSFLKSLENGQMILKYSPIFVHLITKFTKFKKTFQNAK